MSKSGDHPALRSTVSAAVKTAMMDVLDLVPLGVILPTSITLALFCALVVRMAVKAQRVRVGTGVEGLAAEIGSVTETLEPEGKIFIHGEIWDASSTGDPIPRGTRVKVVRVDEMRLTVEPVKTQRS